MSDTTAAEEEEQSYMMCRGRHKWQLVGAHRTPGTSENTYKIVYRCTGCSAWTSTGLPESARVEPPSVELAGESFAVVHEPGLMRKYVDGVTVAAVTVTLVASTILYLMIQSVV
jgi:hypothetical protein